ncbi:DNA polymerase Y family protein [Acidihalobacter ferrooxydans]|uniref:DNA polymerase IV n=1 Tax=Acidihalobacter ferrooxydans TaxID=1765967 RepID=A0A1P8UH85_9GAMM|nr:DNA polymerase IV [Acidihalobacter ferrooxydans]APZ43205.1 DNA polymerase IV [Acidihalobacter ferrooxydans]
MGASQNPTVAAWPRMIALVDMNAFFASIEQRERPQLRRRPVAVTNGDEGTCIITSSYEARACGVRTGMRLREARRLCPGLIRVTARSALYAEVSTRIMDALRDQVSPDIEVFSVDEAFLDLTRMQRLYGSAELAAEQVRRVIHAVSGLPCSVGVAGDKTTAKWAAKQRKPNGCTVVAPWESAERLRYVPVTELCGVGRGIGAFLAQRGVRTCGEMAALPVGELARRWGNVGRRIWLMAQGQDPEAVRTDAAPPKSIGHGKVLPPATTDERVLRTYLEHMAHKVAERLRRHQLEAQQFFIGVKTDMGWVGGRQLTAEPTDDSRPVIMLCRRVLHEVWLGQPAFQVQVTALDPRLANIQLELFAQHNPHRGSQNRTLDEVNRRFGSLTVGPASLLGRSMTADVIAPAWRPHGHRHTV